jgi:hypothetical protein
MAQSRRGVISRRAFLQWGATMLASLFLERHLPERIVLAAPQGTGQAGVFPFDLSASLTESRVSRLNIYIHKIFMPFVGGE